MPLLLPALLLAACADAPASAPASGPASAPAAPAAAAPVRALDVAGLKAALDAGAVPLLIDVRTAEEYAGGHVPGAKNVPLDQLASRLAELGTPAAEVYVICQSGRRSAQASATLAEKGLRPVNITGGTSAWSAAGYATEPAAR